MRWILLVACCLSLVGRLYADASEPLQLRRDTAVSGRVRFSTRDTSHVLVTYQRPAWDVASGTCFLGDQGLPSLREIAPDLEVLDADFWSGNIVVLGRTPRGIVARCLAQDGRTTLGQVQLVASTSTLSATSHGATAPKLIVSKDGSQALALVDGVLSHLQMASSRLTCRVLEEHVTSACHVQMRSGAGLVYSYTSGSSSFLSLADSSMQVVLSSLVPLSGVYHIEQVGSTAIIYSALEGANGCVLTILDLERRSISTRSVPLEVQRVTGVEVEGQVALALLTTRSGRPELVVVPLASNLDQLPEGVFIAGDYGTPRLVRAFGDTVLVAFSGGMALVRANGDIIARDAMSLPDLSGSDIDQSGRLMSIHSALHSVVIRAVPQPLWFIARSIDGFLRYVIPLLFLASLGVVYFLYRRQKRFLEAMIDAPGAGFVLFVDLNGRLLRANEKAAHLLRLTADVPMGRMFESYTQQPGLQQLHQFVDRVRLSREAHTERITIMRSEEQKEYMASSTPVIGTLGSSRGILISGVDITETLEQRRLVNWAQLAHDMQTNLSTIRLNAEQFRGDSDAGDEERRRRILFQVGVLIDRVRDLLGVARSDVFQRGLAHSAELCTEVRHEFDPAMFPHVTFSMKLRGTFMQVDRLKLSRAIRNAVENAIKALRNQPGTVEISTWFDRTNVFIAVSDTGIGMDPETMANMMKPYFSTANDGTGHGIGTMIMHHVTKLHGGTIRVTSEPGKGTQVVFRIPHGMDPKEKIRVIAAERVQ